MPEKTKRRKPKRSPNARSMQWFSDHGFIVDKVEQRLPIPGTFITRDVWNFGDLLVAKKDWGIALVQVTSNTDSDSNLNAREKKARAIPELEKWLEAGGRFILHAWKEEGRGKHLTATLTQREISLINLATDIPF
jgi:hypothetical protein